MGQAQAWDWIHRLTPILNQALGYEKQLPARKNRDIEQILAACPGLECIIGGVKTFGIVRNIFRYMREGFDDLVMETACGLHNLRCDFPIDCISSDVLQSV